jgi:hypothetical protein
VVPRDSIGNRIDCVVSGFKDWFASISGLISAFVKKSVQEQNSRRHSMRQSPNGNPEHCGLITKRHRR